MVWLRAAGVCALTSSCVELHGCRARDQLRVRPRRRCCRAARRPLRLLARPQRLALRQLRSARRRLQPSRQPRYRSSQRSTAVRPSTPARSRPTDSRYGQQHPHPGTSSNATNGSEQPPSAKATSGAAAYTRDSERATLLRFMASSQSKPRASSVRLTSPRVRMRN
jgi:hypothetical protein